MIFVAILIGYLLGSISPAYILGRTLKGIDIREHGTGNAGTRNVKKMLGLWPAVICALFDLSKGLLSMLIAQSLGQPELIIYLAGYAAVLGHIFPFYLKFRGGEGSATSVAILIFLLIKAVLNYWIMYDIIIPLTVLASSVYYITKLPEMIGAFVLPALALLLYLSSDLNLTIIFIDIILLQLFIVTLLNIKRLKLLDVTPAKEQLWHWRVIMRPLAVVFVILPHFVDQKTDLYFIGALALIFILLDLARLLISKFNAALFTKTKEKIIRKSEKHKFSSITFFLSAIFILYLVFPPAIASVSALFLIFGDLAAKFFGLLYSRTPLFNKKSTQGSLAFFAFSFFFGYLVSFYLPIPVWLIFVGALTASITDLFYIFGLSDNFTVGLISASAMYAISFLA